MDLSELLRHLLKDMNCSVSEAAKASHQSAQNLSNKLNRGSLSYTEFEKIAEALGVGVEITLSRPDQAINDISSPDDMAESKIELLKKQLELNQQNSKFANEIFKNIRNNMSIINGCTTYALNHVTDHTRMINCLNNIRLANDQINNLLNEGSYYNVYQSDDRKNLSSHENFPLQKLRVLLAEDHPLICEISAEILTDAGYVVETAKNGIEAFNKITAAEPGYYDFILMDIEMDKMDGLETTRKIRALRNKDTSDIPIFAISASTSIENIQEAKNAGMNEFLSKPLNIQTLSTIVQHYIGKSR